MWNITCILKRTEIDLTCYRLPFVLNGTFPVPLFALSDAATSCCAGIHRQPCDIALSRSELAFPVNRNRQRSQNNKLRLINEVSCCWNADGNDVFREPVMTASALMFCVYKNRRRKEEGPAHSGQKERGVILFDKRTG